MSATPSLPRVATGDNLTASQWNQWIVDNIAEIWKGQAAGDLDYYSGAATKSRLAGGSGNANKLLKMNSAGNAPEWGLQPVLFTAGSKQNTSWDGDSKSAAKTAILPNSFHSDIPANARALIIAVSASFAGTGQLTIRPAGATNANCITVRNIVNGAFNDAIGIVPLSETGFEVDISATATVYLDVWGYFL